ncbi:MAG: dockerin type I repeat-containing protein [Acutalibacteraceae bacterium]
MKKRFIVCLALALIAACSAFIFLGSSAFAVTTNVRGDINCDGVLDRKDYLLLKRYLAGEDLSGETFDESKCDIDQNGQIDKSDLITLLGPASDLSGDNKLTRTDFNLLQRYITKCDMSKVTFYESKADYNCDGKIDLADLRGIANDASDMGTYSPQY